VAIPPSSTRAPPRTDRNCDLIILIMSRSPDLMTFQYFKLGPI
jgi:hypothetical protein